MQKKFQLNNFLKKLLICFSFCIVLFQPTYGSSSQCRLRIMDGRELSLRSDIIARVRVGKVKNIRDPLYGELATLEILEMIKGDPRIKKVTVWAKSKIHCASDEYIHGQEYVVFLVHDQTLYKTLNWQYGQFLIGSSIKGWHSLGTNFDSVTEHTYEQVKNEVQHYLMRSQQPKGEIFNQAQDDDE